MGCAYWLRSGWSFQELGLGLSSSRYMHFIEKKEPRMKLVIVTNKSRNECGKYKAKHPLFSKAQNWTRKYFVTFARIASMKEHEFPMSTSLKGNSNYMYGN